MAFAKGYIPWNKGIKQWEGKTHPRKGKEPWNKGKKGLISHKPWNKGLKGYINSGSFVKGQPSITIGEKNYQWKGDKVSYKGLHDWIGKHLGKPDTCEHCGKNGLSGKKIHWANKSHEYKRDLTDWVRLCVSCHKAYDNAF